MKGVTLEDLKGDMHDLASAIGVEETLELCSLFAGDNLYIPLAEREESGDIKELKEILGSESYERLQMSFGGTTLYFPTRSTVLREYITKRVQEEYDGTNRRRLMRQYNLTKNSFYRMIEGTEKAVLVDDKQLTIFDLWDRKTE